MGKSRQINEKLSGAQHAQINNQSNRYTTLRATSTLAHTRAHTKQYFGDGETFNHFALAQAVSLMNYLCTCILGDG